MVDRSHSHMRYENIAGALLFSAGVLAFLGIITAETLYPGYSTSQNMISDLGATEPPNSIIIQPASSIFSASMAVTGILIIFSAYCINQAFRKRTVTAPMALFGIGVLGVGIFNGSYGAIHGIFALMAFVMGGISAIAGSGIEKTPLNYFSVILGGIALLDLLLYYIMGNASPFAAFGLGGLERWIAYPILLWVTGFGGYLMGYSKG
ncbi:DUF998 domain-containing protein [Methanosarcina sp. T3]|uniref:DUF998 domain-containing protein n=1 Tax=Methanosarcina sp. T3 TaxID=3439062 RepID=UPI003F878BB5